MKLKIWQVIWGLKDGGAENLAREYAQMVDADRFDTTIVTMYPFENTANYRRAMDAGLNVLSVFRKRNAVTRGIKLLFGRWYVPFVLKRFMKRENPDVIHFNNHMAAEFLPLEQTLSGKRLVYTCHSAAEKYFHGDAEEAAVRELIKNRGLRLIGLHEDMRKALNARFGIQNTAVIKNGVDIARFRSFARPNMQVRNAVGIPEDAFVVGHVGRFTKVKNHAFLIDVFSEIAARNKNARLLLVGNGDLETEIRNKLEALGLTDRVTMLSHRTDIPELLSAMDVMVFPSFFEGLSVTLVEAQASGLRCIVSDSVNGENFLAETTIPMSLDSGAEKWAEAALDTARRNPDHGNINDYDMNREIKRLEKIYQGYDPD